MGRPLSPRATAGLGCRPAMLSLGQGRRRQDVPVGPRDRARLRFGYQRHLSGKRGVRGHRCRRLAHRTGHRGGKGPSGGRRGRLVTGRRGGTAEASIVRSDLRSRLLPSHLPVRFTRLRGNAPSAFPRRHAGVDPRWQPRRREPRRPTPHRGGDHPQGFLHALRLRVVAGHPLRLAQSRHQGPLSLVDSLAPKR